MSTKRERMAQLTVELYRTPQGREFLDLLMDYCGIDKLPFSTTDQYLTAFNCGKQSVGVYLAEKLKSKIGDRVDRVVQEQEQAQERTTENDE